MTRRLEIIRTDGSCMAFIMPDTVYFEPTVLGQEVMSASELIFILEKYSKGLQKLRERIMNLEIGKPKKYDRLDDMMHSLVNARKYIDMPLCAPLEIEEQKFVLDLKNNLITFYSKNDDGFHERGSMMLNGMYSNWIEILYPDYLKHVDDVGIQPEDAECEEHDEDSEPLPPMEIEMSDDEDDEEYDDSEEVSYAISEEHRDKMEALITDQESESAYELWYNLFVEKELVDKTVIIKYSGAGDSGCTDDISVYHKARYKAAKSYEEVMAAEVKMDPPLTHDDRLETLIWGLISTREGGFYNDEGGYGEMILSSTSFQWDHYNYISDTRHDVASSFALDEDDKAKLELPF